MLTKLEKLEFRKKLGQQLSAASMGNDWYIKYYSGLRTEQIDKMLEGEAAYTIDSLIMYCAAARLDIQFVPKKSLS